MSTESRAGRPIPRVNHDECKDCKVLAINILPVLEHKLEVIGDQYLLQARWPKLMVWSTINLQTPYVGMFTFAAHALGELNYDMMDRGT
jgi:hypothetical protein